jgi:hypothetical protein
MSNYLNEASPIVTVISGGLPNVFGAFVELIPSTARVSGWLWIFYHGFGVALGAKHHFLNIATGSAGSEVVQMCKMGQHTTTIFPNRPGGYYHGYSLPWTFGSSLRLSCQIANEETIGTATYKAKIRLWEKPTA